jgi:hypothetical protein
MKYLLTTFGLAGIALLVAGCVAKAGDSAADENVEVAAQAEIDGGVKAYLMTQLGVTTASSWAGTNINGAKMEFWVAKPGYSATAARTFSGSSATCTDWKRSVCGASFAGSTYYRATFTEVPLDCAFPPGPCAPPAGAVSFLGAGSYRTTASVGGVPSPFAWTYSTGTCEYWANAHPITTGLSTQSPLSPAYTSLSQFETSVCGLSPVPTTFYTTYYEPVANFCSIQTY